MPLVLPAELIAASESWALDGLDFNRPPWHIESLKRSIPQQRPTWLESPDEDGALLLEDPKVGPAVLEFRLRLDEMPEMDSALEEIKLLEAKLSECSATRGGLSLVWTPQSATNVATIAALAGEITDVPEELQGQDAGWLWLLAQPVVTVRLTTEPYGDLDEVAGPSVTSSDAVAVLEVPDIPGTAPAKGRLVVTETDGITRRHLEIGLETDRFYDFADGDLLIAAADLVTSGFAGLPGTLASTPVTLCSTGDLGHVGTFRVKTSVLYDPLDVYPAVVYARLSWREGDGPLRSNPWALVFASDPDYCELDLGVITIPPAKKGAQKWEGRIEAYTSTPGDTLDVRHLELIPTLRYGKGRAPFIYKTPTAFSARDEFDQSAGNLNGKTLPAGGTWATSGDAGDLAVEATGHTAERATSGDATSNDTSRIALAGAATYEDVVVQVDAKRGVGAGTVTVVQGVVARYVDANNFLALKFFANEPSVVATSTLTVFGLVGGVALSIPDASVTVASPAVGAFYTLRLLVTADGLIKVAWSPAGTEPTAWLIETSHSALAEAGALASGKAGFFDTNTGAGTVTRNYDNFLLWEPEPAAVIFPNQSAEVRHDAAIRENAAGTYWGKIQPWRGRFLVLPQAGDKDLTSRLFVKARANDVDEIADDATFGEITAQLFIVPRVKVVP